MAYSFFRYLHPVGVAEAASHTNLTIGAANTAVLLTSSFFMSWASLEVREGESRAVGWLMFITAGLGIAFIVLKAAEYTEDLHEHLWPGESFVLPISDPKVGEVFFFPLLAAHRHPRAASARGRHRDLGYRVPRST